VSVVFDSMPLLSNCMGVKIGNKKGDMEKIDYHEIKKLRVLKYIGKRMVRNG
jgi:hypothetical protein